MGAGWPMQLPRKQKSEQRRKQARSGWAAHRDKAFCSSVARSFRRHQREGEAQHLEGAGQARREGGTGVSFDSIAARKRNV